jgi:diguanylate cyclase (GGDEF)-like protein
MTLFSPAPAPAPAELLLVDDDPSIIQAASRLLADLGRCRFARRADVALRLLRSEPVDLVLLDAEMPGMGGLELLATLQRDPALAGIPVLLLTSHRDERIEEAAFEAGAVDFITKPIRPAILRARVGMQLRLKRAMDALHELAHTDSLTGLANRRTLTERLQTELARAQRDETPVSLLMVDVDHFKRYNDHYGHPAGDRALQQVADCLRGAAARPGDLAARWGGEEFALLLPATDTAGALAVAEAARQSLAALAIPHAQSPEAWLTMSIGIATRLPPPGGAQRGSPPGDAAALVAALLSRADEALYEAKAAGRNREVARAA